MNRLAVAPGAVSLAQGFPDFACPPELKRAVAEAVDADINQYAITWGSKPLRDAIAETTPRHFPGWGEIDPETQVTVTCGATEAMIAAMLGLLDPGDEVIVFEPYYENYGPDAILSRRDAALRDAPRAGLVDRPGRAARARSGRRTRGIVVNSPHNPTGKVFTRDELELIAELCQRARRHRLHRRHLRAPRVRGRAHPARDAPRDGRTDRVDPLDVEDVLGHRLADRLDHRPARPVGRHPARPRLPDRRRRGAAAGRRPSRPWASRDGYYADLVAGLPRAARRPGPGAPRRPGSGSTSRPAPTTS